MPKELGIEIIPRNAPDECLCYWRLDQTLSKTRDGKRLAATAVNDAAISLGPALERVPRLPQ